MRNIIALMFVLSLSLLVGCFGNDEGYNPDGGPTTEICGNGIDDDQNGVVDDDCDGDGDGYCINVPSSGSIRCGHDDEDCNDGNVNVNPGHIEACGNGIDDNCNGAIDENCPVQCLDPREGSSCGPVGIGACQRYGTWQCTSGQSGAVCTAQAGQGQAENGALCSNGIDDDCDGMTDASDTDCLMPRTWYQDLDGDTFGCQVVKGNCLTMMAINQPQGYVANSTDCNDAAYSSTNQCTTCTSTTEICDGQDNDCDGSIDEGCRIWYRDADGDTYGCQTSVSASCQTQTSVTQPTGYVANSTDCNDAAYSSTNSCTPQCTPATEICDGQDNDCDGLVDDGCQLWYRDADGDTYGCQTSVSASCQTMQSVTQPSGYVANSTDCNDAAYSSTNQCTTCTPSTEVCDSRDNDCDGSIDEGGVCSCPYTKTTDYESGGLCTNGIDDDCDGLLDQNDPGCQNACLSISGGTVRFDLTASVQNACPNRAIIMYGSYAEGGRAHFSAYNATYFSEYISSGWFNGDTSNYMRMQIVCGLSQAQYNQMIADPGNWWTYQGSATLYVNGLSLSSDLSASGITMSFNGKPMANDTVVTAPGGRVGQSWLPQCGG